MKKIGFYLLSAYLSFIGVSKAQEKIIMSYNGKQYSVQNHIINEKKRENVYEIYEKDNFIGDEGKEIDLYKNLALASDFYFDKKWMVSDLEDIINLFSETKNHEKLNQFINNATQKVSELGTEIMIARQDKQDQISLSFEKEYKKEFKETTNKLGKEILLRYKKGKLNNERDFSTLLEDFFLNDDKTKSIIKDLRSLESEILKISPKNSVEEILNLKSRLYSSLMNGYENFAYQEAYIKARESFPNKLILISNSVLDIAFKDNKKVQSILNYLKISKKDRDERIEGFVQEEVKRVSEVVRFLLYYEEEQFNLSNHNTLAYKFLKDKIENNFSLKDLLISSAENNCSSHIINNDEIILYAKGCDFTSEKFDLTWIKVDFPYDFKNKKASLSFDLETVKGYAANCYIGIDDHEIPRRSSEGNGMNLMAAYEPGKTMHWEIYFDNNLVKFIGKCKEDSYSFNEEFNINNLSKGIFRIMLNAINDSPELSEAEIKLKNIKINN